VRLKKQDIQWKAEIDRLKQAALLSETIALDTGKQSLPTKDTSPKVAPGADTNGSSNSTPVSSADQSQSSPDATVGKLIDGATGLDGLS
jgi:hypothetical protein